MWAQAAAMRAPARAQGGGGRGGSAGGSGGIARATGEHVLQPDETLMAECKVDTLRGSGPGGQHRNKTETGVRLTHLPTDVRAEAFEERSQQRNKDMALKRLRMKLALELRTEVSLGAEGDEEPYVVPPQLKAILPSAKQRLGPKHADFPKGIAALLDVLSAAEWKPPIAAKALGCTSSAIIKILASDKAVLALVNGNRQRAGLNVLKAK
eukprot:PRCOL_00001818-RA